MPEPKFLENFDPPADEPTTTPPPAPVPAPEAAPAAAKPADAPVEAPKAAESKEDKETAAYKQAMLDERRKRQEIEQREAYWRGRAEAAAQKPQTEEDAKKRAQELENRFLVDPVGYTDSLIQERIADAVLKDRWGRSVYSVEREHKDWMEKRDGYLKLANEDPTLVVRANSHPDPARFVYEYMKQRDAAVTAFDPEAERKRIREEERAAARKELALSEAGATPPTLAGVNGSGGGGSVASTGPDVGDLFKDKPY